MITLREGRHQIHVSLETLLPFFYALIIIYSLKQTECREAHTRDHANVS